MDDQHWSALAACRDAPLDALFVQGAAQRVARQVCAGCPVRVECLADALDSRTDFGVWGGATERERRALLRRWPDVPSWRDLLEAQPSLVPRIGPRPAGPRLATAGASDGPGADPGAELQGEQEQRERAAAG
jgi:WhiB family transcriptional regulator, redox-sensing transcriptional regulator